MRLLSFLRPDGSAACGVALAEGVADITARLGIASLRALLEAGRMAEAEALTQVDFPYAAIRFAPVIPNPDKIICVGLNYHDHVQETGNTVTPHPALFVRFPASQVGHGEPLIRPKVSDKYDYEGELAVIIGRGGRHIPPSQALSHVAGYACYNEGSIRDWQRHTGQFLAGKSFDRSGSFGPWMETSITDPASLTLETRLNGEVVQHSATSLMITPVPEQIAYISTIMPLLPGDVIVSGTPGGVGARRTPPLWMKPGDVAEVEITGIGILRNPVEQEA